MGLFDKKYCSVCGEKIGFLGNRKLEDGNLCKDCARKLSPFFSERRHSTVAEIEEQLGYAWGDTLKLQFTPHLIPMHRGILATETARLNGKYSYEDVKAAYDRYYGDEKFIRVLKKDMCPETRIVEGSNYTDVNFRIDERTGNIIMMGALDNLEKGAASQAVQNFNVMFGFPEEEGIDMIPMVP